MDSKERILLPNLPHHLMRTAEGGESVFKDAADHRYGLRQMYLLAKEYQLGVQAWTLLPTGIHLIVTPGNDPKVLSTFMKSLTCRISMRHKKRYGEPAAWHHRCKISPVEPGQWALACMCFVERLAMEVGEARSAYHYEFSSYRMRLGKTEHYWLSDPEEYKRLGGSIRERAEAFSTYVRSGLDAKERQLIHIALMRGALTGSPQFYRWVEKQFGIKCSLSKLARSRKDED